MKGMVGIGLRRDIAEEILEQDLLKPDFIEFAPENWMGVGGNWNRGVVSRDLPWPFTFPGQSGGT